MSAEERLADLEKTGVIEMPTFRQILEMDDDEDERDFSRSIVFEFFDQAENTFAKMDSALQKKDLAHLSQLGHFLKGSSATIGLIKVRDSCEKIQNYGSMKDETGNHSEPEEEVCLSLLDSEISTAKEEYEEVEQLLRQFYSD